jgi:hypothetical protein
VDDNNKSPQSGKSDRKIWEYSGQDSIGSSANLSMGDMMMMRNQNRDLAIILVFYGIDDPSR